MLLDRNTVDLCMMIFRFFGLSVTGFDLPCEVLSAQLQLVISSNVRFACIIIYIINISDRPLLNSSEQCACVNWIAAELQTWRLIPSSKANPATLRVL